MDEKRRDIVDTIAKLLFGIFGSLIIGYLFFQQKIFNLNSSQFMYTALGIYGAIFFSLAIKLDLKKQILILISVILFNIILVGKLYHLLSLIRDFVMIVVVFLSIKAYVLFILKNKNIPPFLRAFGLAAIYAVFNACGIFILFLLSIIIEGNKISYLSNLILINSEMAGLVGLGLGLGFDSWELIKSKFLNEKLAEPV